MIKVVAATFAAALLACSPAAPSPATQHTSSAAMMPEKSQPAFEYIIVVPPDPVYDVTLNRLGNEGWEVVSQRRVRDALDDMAYEVTLKRQKRDGVRPTTSNDEQLKALTDYRTLLEAKSKKETVASQATTSSAPAQATVTSEAPKPLSAEEQRKIDQRRAEIAAFIAARDKEEEAYVASLPRVYLEPAWEMYHVKDCPKVTAAMKEVPISQRGSYVAHRCVPEQLIRWQHAPGIGSLREMPPPTDGKAHVSLGTSPQPALPMLSHRSTPTGEYAAAAPSASNTESVRTDPIVEGMIHSSGQLPINRPVYPVGSRSEGYVSAHTHTAPSPTRHH